MSDLTERRLNIELSLHPEPLKVREDEKWIHVGSVSVSRKYASFNIGFTHPMSESSRFECEQFAHGDKRGWAIMFYPGDTLPSYFAGWMRDSESEQAAQRVAHLNEEIARIVRGNISQKVELLTFHQGAEYAPDSPWGSEALRLSCDGELEYERRRSGKVLHVVHGHVDSTRVHDVIAALERTTFPERLQRFFPPGASVCTLITEPPFRRMDIEFSFGLQTEGYATILKTLSQLCQNLRENKTDQLASWTFTPAR